MVEGDFGRIAVEIKHTTFVESRDLRSLRDFVNEHQARLGLVITNDRAPRLLEEKLVALPFAWL